MSVIGRRSRLGVRPTSRKEIDEAITVARPALRHVPSTPALNGRSPAFFFLGSKGQLIPFSFAKLLPVNMQSGWTTTRCLTSL